MIVVAIISLACSAVVSAPDPVVFAWIAALISGPVAGVALESRRSVRRPGGYLQGGIVGSFPVTFCCALVLAILAFRHPLVFDRGTLVVRLLEATVVLALVAFTTTGVGLAIGLLAEVGSALFFEFFDVDVPGNAARTIPDDPSEPREPQGPSRL